MQVKEIIEQFNKPPAFEQPKNMRVLAEAVAALRKFCKALTLVTVKRADDPNYVIVDVDPPSLKESKQMVDELFKLGVRLWIQDRNHFISCRGNPFLKEVNDTEETQVP